MVKKENERRRLQTILIVIYTVVGVVIAHYIYRGFRPPSNNHILLINNENKKYVSPLTIQFTGDTSSWSKTIHGEWDLKYEFALVEIDKAFFPGQIEVIDGNGALIRKCKLSPPGRHNHTAVILLPYDNCFPANEVKFHRLPYYTAPIKQLYTNDANASESKNPPADSRESSRVRGTR